MSENLNVSFVINIIQNQYFGSNWLSRNKKETLEAQKMIWLNNIINASSEIFKYHILLLLSGEYCDLSDSNSIEQLENYLEEVYSKIEFQDDESIQLELQSRFFDNILTPLKYFIIPEIRYLLRDLNVQFNIEYKRPLLRATKKEPQNYTDISIVNYYNAFRYAIYITSIEHFFYSKDQEIIKKFLYIEKELEELSIDENIKSPILIKLRFLLKKILYRFENFDNEETEELLYSFDHQEDKSLHLQSINIDDKLIKWDNIIQVHYGFSNNYKKEQRKRAEAIYRKNYKEYLYEDYHTLIKIFKDDTKSKQQVKNLLENFKKRNNDNKIKLDDYASKVTESYLFNNSISLQCEQKRITFNELQELFIEIKNQQNKDNIRNYFPWEKLAATIGKCMDKLLDSLINKKNYDLFNEFLSLYSKTVKEFEKSLKWSKNKNYLPFQMQFSECKSDYEITISGFPPKKLFFYSAFLLPIDYKRLEMVREDLNLRKLKYDTIIAVYDKMHILVDDVKESSDKMKNQERRSVEILAIFSAVALFSVGSIQIFSQNSIINDPKVYYRFILSFGHSLSIFVLLIWIVTRDNFKKINIYHCIILGVLIGSLLINLLYFK